MRVIVFLFVAAFIHLSVPATAQESAPRLVNKFDAWALYTFDSEQGRVCYIASTPTKEDGNYTLRGQAAVLVSKLPLSSGVENEQVSIQPGYNYLKDSDVDVTIGETKYVLFTDGEHAWAETSEEDQKLITSMRRGAEMVVRGTSVKNTFSLDTYSLRGFTAAYNSMKETCGN